MKIISTGYNPRRQQYDLHLSLKRFNVLVAHRRFGKTVFTVEDMRDRGLRHPLKNPQMAYIATSYGQAKRVAWEFMKEGFRKFPRNLISINESDLRIDVQRPHRDDKVRYILLGAEKPSSLLGLYLDWFILDEYGDCDPRIFSKVLRPAVSDRLGGGIFIGTPQGDNHFHELYKKAQGRANWFTAMYKASQTGILSRQELEDARLSMSEAEYAAEYECDFNSPLVGAYYGVEMAKAESQGRITHVPYDSNFKVHTFWDLGTNDANVVWFMQEVFGDYRFIDYLSTEGKSVPEIVSEVRAKGYPIATWYMPHDVEHREYSTGQERIYAFKKAQVNPIYVVPKGDLMDGINASRLAIRRSSFDNVKCKDGVKALKNYRREYDAEKQVFNKTPLHNWASHAADGFRTFSMGYIEGARRAPKNVPTQQDNDYSVLNYSGE